MVGLLTGHRPPKQKARSHLDSCTKKEYPDERSASISVLPRDISKTPPAKFDIHPCFGPLSDSLIAVPKRTARLLPPSTAVSRSGDLTSASDDALSRWHCSRTLWSGEHYNRMAKPIESNLPHIQSISSQELDLSSPTERSVPSTYPPSKQFFTVVQLQDNARCSLASPLRRTGQPNKVA